MEIPQFTDTYTYNCVSCDFKCNKKGDWSRHIKSSKHASNSDNILCNHICLNCNKKYNSRVGLWSHKKKCMTTASTDKDVILTTLINEQNMMKKMISDIYAKLEKQNIK
jgi:hypothetical protein